MRKRFAAHIVARALFTKKQKLLLAVSGGADSVVMCHLLFELGYQISLAHCNYKLRGKDSDTDEKFCRDLAAKLKIPIYVKTLNLRAKRSERSLQEEARELRYRWFSDLKQTHGFDYLLTAHHASDQAETLILNLLRGTGLKGMRGIAEKEGWLVRPLLVFSREEVMVCAAQSGIKFRTDKSNLNVKYRRNYIRHKIMPLLKKINPSAELTLAANARKFTQEYSILQRQLETAAAGICSTENGVTEISTAGLPEGAAAESVLYHVLEPFGFNSDQVNEIFRHISSKAESGRRFYSAAFRLSTERNKLHVVKKSIDLTESVTIKNSTELLRNNVFAAQYVKEAGKTKKHEVIISERMIQWPLTVRGWKQGDRFMPFGMKGHKLVSDLAREQKLGTRDKERLRILENGNGDIIWVIGIRSDERYRVQEKDSSLIKLSVLEQN